MEDMTDAELLRSGGTIRRQISDLRAALRLIEEEIKRRGLDK